MGCSGSKERDPTAPPNKTTASSTATAPQPESSPALQRPSSLSKQAPADDYRKLIQAARTGDLATLASLVASKYDLNKAGDSLSMGERAIHAAAACGNVETVLYLLDNGADANVAMSSNVLAIHKAAGNGHLAVVELLLQRNGAKSASSTDETGQNALHYAANANNAEVVKALLGAKVDVNAVTNSGDTALHVACRQGTVTVVRALLEAPDIDTRIVNKAKLAPIAVARASAKDSGEIVQLLSEWEAQHPVDAAEVTPESVAVTVGQDRKWSTLTVDDSPHPSPARDSITPQDAPDAVVSENVTSTQQATAVTEVPTGSAEAPSTATVVETATESAAEPAASELATNAASEDVTAAAVESTATESTTDAVATETVVVSAPVVTAADHVAEPVVTEAAVEEPVVVTQPAATEPETAAATETATATPAVVAPIVVSTLSVPVQALPGAISPRGRPSAPVATEVVALFSAARANNVEEIKRLADSGVDLNVKEDQSGDYLLHVAAEKGFDDLARLLLSAGVTIDVTDFANQTPLHRAVKNGSVGIVSILLQAGADVNAPDRDRCTPLHVSASSNQTECAKLLLKQENVDVNATGGAKWETALHFAARGGYVAVLREILAHENVDARTTNKTRVTPRATARASKTPQSEEIEKLLLEWETARPRALRSTTSVNVR